jgi:hypothetical protein
VLFWDDSAHAVHVVDPRTGDVVASTDGVNDYVGRDGRTLWFSVAGGGLKSLDLDTDASIAIHNTIVRGAVRVEGHVAVAVIDGRLSTIALPGGRVAALPVNGRWVGGPADGTIFIARSDGTYAQRLAGGKPVRVVIHTSKARFLTADGVSAFFATNDRMLVGVGLTHLTATAHIATACDFVEGVRTAGDVTLVHCDQGATSRLYGYGPAQSLRRVAPGDPIE